MKISCGHRWANICTKQQLYYNTSINQNAVHKGMGLTLYAIVPDGKIKDKLRLWDIGIQNLVQAEYCTRDSGLCCTYNDPVYKQNKQHSTPITTQLMPAQGAAPAGHLLESVAIQDRQPDGME